MNRHHDPNPFDEEVVEVEVNPFSVLFDLFQHDMRLWKAYSITLQSHPAFTEYHDLLGDLDERLSSTETFEEK